MKTNKIKFLMKLYLISLILVTSGLTNIYAQDNHLIINGFSKYIAGEEVDEDCSCTPEATTAMTVRCLSDKDFIEWETDKVPVNYTGKTVSFVWSGGYSTGKKDEERKFSLFINNNFLFSFATASRIEGEDWKIKKGDAELKFKNQKFYNRSGNTTKDYWGFFILTVPVSELKGNRILRIKVNGDATGSRHWYRVMAYQLLPKVEIDCEKIVTKDSCGRNLQTVKVSINHFTGPRNVQILSENKIFVDEELKLGQNDFFIKFDAVKTAVQKSVEVKIDENVEKFSVTIQPVKKMTFYLLPHSHVDIGYTDLQTEIEKKQWNNIDKAMNLSEKTSEYKSGSSFKWNTEVLWAVKSYLENFPKKKILFIDAVKKGWIGLDANYANLLTGLCRPEELYRLVDYSNELEKITGVKIESAMISDVPGYTWGTSQVFADNGIKYFSVGTNESDRIGNSLKTWGDKPFYWETPSGKNKILVWLAGKGYSWFHHWDLLKDDYSRLMKYLDMLESTNYPYDIVQLRYTIGDNGEPNPNLAEFVKKWNENHLTPQFKLSTTLEMFKDFEKKYSDSIPTYKGDFTPYWEDGAGSSAKETSINRNTAEKLNQLEILYSLNNSIKYPYKEFDEAWKNVLLYSEHTWGAYNSISDPDNEMVKKEWGIKKSFVHKADSIASNLFDLLTDSQNSIINHVEYLNVWNTNSWIRSDVVIIPRSIKTVGDYLLDDSGNQVVTQRLVNGDLVFIAKNVPSLSSRKFRFLKNNLKPLNTTINDYDIKQLTKKILSDSLLSYFDANSTYGLNGFIYTGKNGSNPQKLLSLNPKQKEMGPVVNSIVYESFAPGCNNLTREIRTFNGLRKREIINTIDKQRIYEKENLRFAFPFNIKDPVTRIDIAWSVITPEVSQLKGANKNYFTVQRWIDVSNEHRGITLATIDAPFVELGEMTAESWMSSKGNQWSEHTNSSSQIFSWIMNNSWHTNYKAEQEGVAIFRYALLPHKQFDYLNVYKFGIEQSQPLQIVFSDGETQNNKPVIQLDENAKVVITSLKPSRDGKGMMVRFYNPTPKVNETNVNLNNKKSVLCLSSGDENEIKIIENKITLFPFEVKTIKIITQ